MKTIFTFGKIILQSRIIFSVLILIFTVKVFACSNNVIEAYNTLSSLDDPEFAKGNIEVSGNLEVNFKEMTAHVGQTLWLSVVDKNSGKEVDRKTREISEEFTVSTSGIETGHSYYVNFYADYNENGRYDPPPVDHAWQLEIDNADGDTTLNFVHNANFTDIMWQNRLTVNFTDMDPHIGQNFGLAVIEKNTGKEIARAKTTAELTFTMHVLGIEYGKSYYVNFYADYNQNFRYDSPPVDHAWSLDLDNVTGDTTLNFSHNTGMLTEINWQNRLTINFTGMDPHVGETLWLFVIDHDSGEEFERLKTTISAEFKVYIYGLQYGETYYFDFFADHNQNGKYDAPPIDHAWRLIKNDISDDAILNFSHNTNFTDIFNTTSVEGNKIDRIKIYPNPASERITIETGGKRVENFTISLYDITGKLNQIKWDRINQNIEADLLKIRPGIYFLQIKTNDNYKTFKLIKK